MGLEPKQFLPETIISGFFYLAASFLWVLGLLSKQPQDLDLGQIWANLSAAQAAVGSVVVIGASFILGTLGGRLVSDLFSLVDRIWQALFAAVASRMSKSEDAIRRITDPNPKDVHLVEILLKDPTAIARTMESRFTAKSFFRSVFVGWTLLCLASQPLAYCSSSPDIAHACRVCFWVGEGALLIAYLSQRRSLNSFDAATRSVPRNSGTL